MPSRSTITRERTHQFSSDSAGEFGNIFRGEKYGNIFRAGEYGSIFVGGFTIGDLESFIFSDDDILFHVTRLLGLQPEGQSHNWSTTQSRVESSTGTSTKSSDPPDLVEALLDLHSVQKVAEENGDLIPEPDALPKVERVLRALYKNAPRPYAVYPMPDGDIAIDAHSPKGTKLVVICDPDGSARCLVYLNEKFDRREYKDPSVIPDSFIMEALSKTQVTP